MARYFGLMNVEVRRLEVALEADFWRLMKSEPFGWCYCSAWTVPSWDGWGDRTAEENMAVRERIFREGGHDGYLLFVDGSVAGWCQCRPRAGMAKLERQLVREGAPPAHAISCLMIRPEHRGRGLAHRFLGGILDDLRARGVRRVEAYPKPGRHEDVNEVWTGPEPLFAKAGFREESRVSGRVVMVLELG